MKKTKIEWCDSTWNPVTGCLHGCDYCYARRITERFGGGCHVAPHYHDVENPVENVGVIYEYANGTNHVLDRPYFDAKMEMVAPYPYYFDPTFHRYKLDEPVKWKKTRTIFVCSMADLFGDWVPDEWIEKVFFSCVKVPQHRYLFLTKNPNRYVALYLNQKIIRKTNMWYGVTVTNKKQANFIGEMAGDMPVGCGFFLSIEPILEDVSAELEDVIVNFTDWVIIGAETGNRKKTIPQKEWIDKIISICRNFDIPIFMKDSLLMFMGEENMRREFPWEV